MLFSTIIQNHINSNTNVCTVRNQTIEFDQMVFHLNDAYSFYDCEIRIANEMSPSVTIFTPHLIRFENCKLYASLCVWGQQGAAGYEPLEQIGPSVFFDNCSGNSFNTQVIQGQPTTQWNSKVQISGFARHIRVNPTTDSPLELALSQIRFDKLELVGNYTQVQLVDYIGKEIFFRDVKLNFIWIREDISRISYVDIDCATVKNLSLWIGISKHEFPDFIRTIHMFLDVLSHRKQGKEFLELNNSLCRYIARSSLNKKPKQIWNFILYGFFKNFYSITPWLVISVFIVFLFAGFFLYLTCDNLASVLLNSIYSFSGNPSVNNEKTFLYNALSALEAYIGIFIVIIVSTVLSRKYIAHR